MTCYTTCLRLIFTRYINNSFVPTSSSNIIRIFSMGNRMPNFRMKAKCICPTFRILTCAICMPKLFKSKTINTIHNKSFNIIYQSSVTIQLRGMIGTTSSILSLCIVPSVDCHRPGSDGKK
jgi:hypothetical protein